MEAKKKALVNQGLFIAVIGLPVRFANKAHVFRFR